jgi:hypothetical protein
MNKANSLEYLASMSSQDIKSADVKVLSCKSHVLDGVRYYDIALSINGRALTFPYMTDKKLMTDRDELVRVLPNRAGDDLAYLRDDAAVKNSHAPRL